ncbi:MAG: TadE/TadG family type IV pilus assembly protein [Pseudomonadota bacterium]
MALQYLYTRAFRRNARKLAGDESGVTSVEFAFLSIPYFLIIAGIIEIGMVALSGSTLQTGVREAGRLTRVGLGGCFSQEEYKKQICENSSFVPECEAKLSLKQEVFKTGWEDADTAKDDDDIYQDATGGDVVLMTAKYPWEVMSPFMYPFMADGQGNLEIARSFVFQTEAWQTNRCRPEDEEQIEAGEEDPVNAG